MYLLSLPSIPTLWDSLGMRPVTLSLPCSLFPYRWLFQLKLLLISTPSNNSARDEEDVLQLQNDELPINSAGEKVEDVTKADIAEVDKDLENMPAEAKDHVVDVFENYFTLLYKQFLAYKYPIDIWIKDILVLILSRDL